MTFTNSCSVAAYQDITVANDGSVGAATTTFYNSGAVTSQTGKVQVTSNGQGSMQFTNSNDAGCPGCTLSAYKAIEVTNSGENLTFANSRTISSVTDQVLIQNNGGSLLFTNTGVIGAVKQVRIADNGTANTGITAFENSGSISSTTDQVLITSSNGTMQFSSTGSIAAFDQLNVSNTGGSLVLTNSGSLSSAIKEVKIQNNGGSMTFTNTGNIMAFSDSLTYRGATGSAEIELLNAGGALLFTNSGNMTASGQIKVSDNGGGSGSTTVNNYGRITSANDQVIITSPIAGSMLFNNVSGSFVSANGQIVVSNGGGSLTFTNSGSLTSTANQLQVQNNGGGMIFGNYGSMTAYKQAIIQNNGGNLSATNSGAISSAADAVQITNKTGYLTLSNSGTVSSATGSVQISNTASNTGALNYTSIANTRSGCIAGATDVTVSNSGGGALTLANDGTMSARRLMTLSATQGDLRISGSGDLNAGSGLSSLSSNSGAVSVSQGNIAGTVTVTGSAGTYFSISTISSCMTVGDVTANGGSINLVAGTGTLAVGNGASLNAIEGNITLQNLDTTTGSITIGQNAYLFAYTHSAATGLGNIYVSIGAIPTDPEVGTTPANVTVTNKNGGQVYFGQQGITTTGSVSLNAIGSNIVFSTGGLPATAITLQSGVYMKADPPAAPFAPFTVTHNNDAFNGTGSSPLTAPAAVTLHVQSAMPACSVTGLDTMRPVQPFNLQAAPQLHEEARQQDHCVPGGTTYEYREGEADTRAPAIPLGSAPHSTGTPADGWSTYELDLTDKQVDEMIENPSILLPVSFVPSSVPNMGDNGVSSIHASNALIKHAGHAQFVIDEHSGAVYLNRGEILVVSHKLSTIKAGECSVTVQPGAIALIRIFDNVLKVRNLYDNSGHGINLNLTDSCLAVNVGQEIVIGAHAVIISKAMHADRISRRATRSYQLACKQNLARSEVSIVSLLQNSAVLSRLVASSSKEDKAIATRLTKIAAVLQTVTGSRGAYSQISP